MFGFGKNKSTAKIPASFTAPIERKRADGETLKFDVHVSGYFAGSGGKPAFTITSIATNGVPNMDLSGFNPSEIAELKKYALNVEYKKLIGQA